MEQSGAVVLSANVGDLPAVLSHDLGANESEFGQIASPATKRMPVGRPFKSDVLGVLQRRDLRDR